MNYERWKPLQDFNKPPDCMDWRHVQMVHAMLTNEWPESIVEIGCARGFSTSAIFEAVEKSGAIRTVDLVDPNPTILLTNAILTVHPAHSFAKFTVHPYDSKEYPHSPKCWIIDGDHWDGAIRDYGTALERKARIIVLHDTWAFKTVIGGHEGSHLIGERLKKDAPFVFEDRVDRPAEWTHRGLVIGFFEQPKDSTLAALNSLL